MEGRVCECVRNGFGCFILCIFNCLFICVYLFIYLFVYLLIHCFAYLLINFVWIHYFSNLRQARPNPVPLLPQVQVTVLDKNDSPPSFGESPLRFTVSEDMLAGRQIATLRASDPDTLGTLTYSLVDGDDNKFTLDASTGQLSLQDTLDRETKSEYQLTVRADDGEQHTDTTIYIEVRRVCRRWSAPCCLWKGEWLW